MLKQKLQQKLSQRLSPQQIQLMGLIELPTDAFEQRVAQELVENIAIEKAENKTDGEETVAKNEIDLNDYASSDDIPSFYQKHYTDNNSRERVQEDEESFHQSLIHQLGHFYLSEIDMLIAKFMVGSINEHGYIDFLLEDICDDLAFNLNIQTTKEHIEYLLKSVIHQLEPFGVGARNFQECLIIQLNHKPNTKESTLAKDIVQNSFDVFVKKHYHKLLSKHHISEEKLKESIKVIEKLNPKPGSFFSGSDRIAEHIIPDFTVRQTRDGLDLIMNQANAPSLYVSDSYKETIEGFNKAKKQTSEQKEAVYFIKQKLDAAKWFVDAVKQRQETLLKTMKAILKFQKSYFLSGDEKDLNPMVLRDISEATELDQSTVSRVVNSKYVDTYFGVKPLKFFFSIGIKTGEGNDVSNKFVRATIEAIVKKEDKKKPYTDEQLAELLKEKGYVIARRTIAKYRDILGVPVARLRKDWLKK